MLRVLFSFSASVAYSPLVPSDLSCCLLAVPLDEAMLFAGLLLEGKCKAGEEVVGIMGVRVEAGVAAGAPMDTSSAS